MVLAKMRIFAKPRSVSFRLLLVMGIAVALLLPGCGSSAASKKTRYENCDIYDYFDNLLVGTETVESDGNGAEVRGDYEGHQVYVLHIGTDYESWVKGGRSRDSVTGGCYFAYTADGKRHAAYYFDNKTGKRCWKIPLYEENGEYAHLSVYLDENGAYGHVGTTARSGSNTPKERDRIDSKGEFYFDQASATMNSLDPSFLVKIKPETSTPADEAAKQSSPQQEGAVATKEVAKVPEGAIDYTEAKSHVGETIAVTGVVKASDYRSDSNHQPTYIDIGASYPDKSRVTMVVWGKTGSISPATLRVSTLARPCVSRGNYTNMKTLST